MLGNRGVLEFIWCHVSSNYGTSLAIKSNVDEKSTVSRFIEYLLRNKPTCFCGSCCGHFCRTKSQCLCITISTVKRSLLRMERTGSPCEFSDVFFLYYHFVVTVLAVGDLC